MKTAVVLACLLVAVSAKPQLGFGFGGASGGANSFGTQGQTSGFLGQSGIQSGGASAGGQAFGLGSSISGANSQLGQGSGFLGSNQFSSQNAFSNQFGR